MSTQASQPEGRPEVATTHKGRAAVAAIPVVLVNTVAFAGQLAFLRAHLPWPFAGQVMMAVALESIAVYLAFHAHAALLANDSALRLRLASYGFALLIGALNYSHYAGPGWRPTFAAVAVGLMSASSPWLWAIHSRRASRDAMLAAGLIEPHALRLGPTRWLWHPYRSARVMWTATWEGVTEPREAVSQWQATRARRTAPGGHKAAVAGGQRQAIEGGRATRRRRPEKATGPRRSAADTEAAVMTALATLPPGATHKDLATAAGVSVRTARRYRRPLETVATATST